MRKAVLAYAGVLAIGAAQVHSQDTTAAGKPIIETLPAFNAGISMGFNYDFISPPTDVSFEYPRGYFGVNIPFKKNIPALDIARQMSDGVDRIFADTTLMRGGEDYRPETSAKQHANTSIRVDVPMMGGVATFSNTQNFYLNYTNTIGNPNLYYDTTLSGVGVLMRGTLNVPLEFTTGWESMTFGYAYRVNKNVAFALNLHRHVFTFDLHGNVNVDILGRYNIDLVAINEEQGAGGEAADYLGETIKGTLDYPSESVRGIADGHYEAEVWSPTIGAALWRFTWTSRFGVNTDAEGSLWARYSLPWFVDPETFEVQLPDTDDRENLTEMMEKFDRNATDSVTFYCDNDLHFTMPQGHTIAFDIIPKKLNISYTKFFGEVGLKLQGIRKQRVSDMAADSIAESKDVGFDIGFSVDHIMMISGKFHNAFFNLGAFAFDLRSQDREHILGKALKEGTPIPTLGESAMLPVLNVGSAIGTKLQLLLELDVLPLPAVKTGVIYYF